MDCRPPRAHKLLPSTSLAVVLAGHRKPSLALLVGAHSGDQGFRFWLMVGIRQKSTGGKKIKKADFVFLEIRASGFDQKKKKTLSFVSSLFPALCAVDAATESGRIFGSLGSQYTAVRFCSLCFGAEMATWFGCFGFWGKAKSKRALSARSWQPHLSDASHLVKPWI